MTLLYLGKTNHQRFFPVKHGFEYPVCFAGVELTELAGESVVKLDGLGAFSLNSADFMGIREQPPGDYNFGTVYLRVLEYIQRTSGAVHLVTMPRCFGYAFNPVNIYFYYPPESAAYEMVVLEVNNTFGESHLYLLHTGNEIKTRIGFQHSYLVKRKFHVSPFNDLQGDYEIHVKKDAEEINVRIVMKVEERKKLIGTLEAKQTEFSWLALFKFVMNDPFVFYATSGRILWEAGKLAYRKNLTIFPRPEPKLESETIVRLSPSSFDSYCLDLVIEWLGSVGLNVSFHLPLSARNRKVLRVGEEEQQSVQVYLNNYNVFSWLVLSGNPYEALLVTLAENDWYCKCEEERDLFLVKMSECLEVSSVGGAKCLLRSLFIDKYLLPFPSKGEGHHFIDVLVAKKSMAKRIYYWTYLTLSSVYFVLFFWFFDLVTPWHEGVRHSPWVKIRHYNTAED